MQNINATAMPLPMGAYGAPQGFGPFGAAQPGMMPAGAMPMQPQGVMPTMGMTGPVLVTPQMAMGQPGMPIQPMHPAGAHAVLGAEGVKPPSTIGSAIKGALVFGTLGAAIGAGATFLPFIPGGPLVGAAVGGVAGALYGAFRGVRSAKRAQEEQMMMGSTPNPNALGQQVPVHTANTNAPAKAKAKAKRSTAGKQASVKVRAGDTLSQIAKQHDVTVKELHEANRKQIGPDPSKLRVGVQLVIPKH